MSYRHVEERRQERGGPVDHATMQRGVVNYRPRWEAAFQRRQRAVWLSWRMDETSIKVKGPWYSRARAVEKPGPTMAFLLTAHRDEAAARHLRKKARRHGVPEKSTLDGSAAKAAARRRSHREPRPEIISRQVQYLHKMVDQEQRGVQRVTRPRLGCKACAAAQGTLGGIERRHMMEEKTDAG